MALFDIGDIVTFSNGEPDENTELWIVEQALPNDSFVFVSKRDGLKIRCDMAALKSVRPFCARCKSPMEFRGVDGTWGCLNQECPSFIRPLKPNLPR